MPKIVNGQVVYDSSDKKENPKPKIMTWRDITSGSGHSTNVNELRERKQQQPNGKKEEKSQETPVPATPSIAQYVARALGIENMQIRIPQEDPKVVIDVVYFVLFAFFWLIFGYKMAAALTVALFFLDPK